MAAKKTFQFKVIKGKSLGFTTFRGYAKLSDLARISQADIFDQETNSTGTQRNLSIKHAREAYRYVVEDREAFYPEIIMNVRNKSLMRFVSESDDGKYGTISLTKPRPREIAISRLDGNHRLWLADGSQRGYDPIDRDVPFSILACDNLNKELKVFRDINDNQMGMNTSHLQNIAIRLLGGNVIKVQNPALYIAKQLQDDTKSPLHKRIHEGGHIQRGGLITGLTIANLAGAVKDMLIRSAKLPQFVDVDAQYRLIRNFWIAVSRWIPDAFRQPSKYIIFKGMGLFLISYIGMDVIDRCVIKGEYKPNDMLKYLKMIPSSYDLSSKSPLKAFGGRSGARKLAGEITSQFEEEGQISVAKLQRQILGSDA